MVSRKQMKHYLASLIRQFPPLKWGLSLGARLFAPKNYVGVVGAIYNDLGQVLLVEHVFRVDYVWGLPGGWVESGENPFDAVLREVKEELNVKIEVKKLLFCLPQGVDKGSAIPAGLCVAFYCRIVDNPESLLNCIAQADKSYEILSASWANPHEITVDVPPLQHKALLLAKQEFDKEQMLA